MSTLRSQITHQLREAIPSLQAIYLFGSVETEYFTKESDIDVAVLTPEPLAPLVRWQLLEQLAKALNRDIDLVDLANATTVMQFQVVSTGERIYAANVLEMEWWELRVYQLYLTLNDDRKPILDAIQASGRIYGK